MNIPSPARRGPSVGCGVWIFIALLIVAAMGANKYRMDRDAEEQMAVARAVSTLPAGSEQAWQAWVDNEVTAKIVRYGRTLKLSAFLESAPIYVSINMPYSVDCAFGIDVNFGDADNGGAIVEIDSPWHRVAPAPADAPASDRVDLSGVNMFDAPVKPSGITVVPDSIAAKGLRNKLCARVAAAMSVLTRER